MRTRRRSAIVALATSFLLPLFLRASDRVASHRPEPFAAELAQLERLRAHALPGSAPAFVLQQKIDRLRAYRAGKPQFDDPGEFARILAEMKIPSDRQAPEYVPGYQRGELQRARLEKSRLAPAEILPWVERGPGNVAGRARGIVVDPDDPTDQTWFIGSVGGGIWKTTDAGATWQWLTADFPVLSTSAIAMAPSNHDVLYAGTGESFYSVDVINGDGILKSTDRGVTWTHLASTAGNAAFNNVARILVDPTSENVVLAATTRGRYKEYLAPRSSIFKSIDGGATWTEVYASTAIGSGGRVKKVLQLVADPPSFDILYATVDEAGILKSTNRGDTWSLINTGITDLSGRFELAISPVDHLRLYAAAEGASHSELWMSTNGGASWSRTTASGSEPNWLGAQGWYDNAIVCHPTDVNTVYVGGIRLWKLTLVGTTRTATLLDAPVHVDHHGLEIIDAPGGGWRLLDTSDGGVAVSTTTDAGWTQPIDGMVTTQFYGIDKRPGASAYVGGTQDNGTWQSPLDPGASSVWSFAIGGDGYETSWHFDDPMKIIGGYQYNGLMRSLDGGQSWSAAITSVSPPGTIDTGGGNAPFITKIAKSQIDPERLFAAGRRGVWRSTDFGATWSLTAIAAGTWGSISSFHDINVSRADPDIVWAGARMDGSGRIHRSTDGGASFTAVPNYTAVTMGGISGLATHPADSNTAFVLFSFAARPKILRTTDGGLNWEDITGFVAGAPSTNGFPDVAVYDLVVFSNDPDRMWAATEIGLVESGDGGANWALADNGLPNVPIWFLTEVEDEIVAGTHGRGVWSVTIPELIAGRTFSPLIEQLYQGPSGLLTADLNLRSAYDSSQVWVDGGPFAALGPNTACQLETMQIPVVAAGTKQVQVRSFRGGTLYPSVTKTAAVFAPQSPVYVYENDFETADSDFLGNQFWRGTEPGFQGSALHSPHPYSDGQTLTHLLTVPIRVAPSHATIEFDEIALVEPGEPGSVFGDPDFWDYVIVEGSRNGLAWTPLAPGYDAREYPEWEAAFSGPAPDSLLLRRRTIDLHDTFAAGDTVLLRFRLFADGSVTGWGWIIDNLRIQPDGTTAIFDAAGRFALALEQNAPNPVRSRTTIRFALPHAEPVHLSVYDVRGRLVRRLVSGNLGGGLHSVDWDGRDVTGLRAASGVYFYRLVSQKKTLQRKMLLVR